MKKNYGSLEIDVIAFSEADVIRTSGVTVSGTFTETDVDFDDYFGGDN